MTVTLTLKSVFFVTTIPSLVYTVYRLNEVGLSRQFKLLLAKRHVAYAIFVVLYQITATISYLDIIGWLNESILA